jgi:hypothetical protein
MLKASTLGHHELHQTIQDGTLDGDSFDHESHVRLAWYYLVNWPYQQAIEKFNVDFLHFISDAGAAGKYHRTITDALLQLIASHLDDPQCRSDWNYFKRDARPLFEDASGLLQRFYSSRLLASDEARNSFQTADLKDLPEPYPGLIPDGRE